MERIGILAITKNGIKIARDLKEKFSSWEIFAPDKFSDGNDEINWYTNSTTEKIAELFKSNDALVCLFSLGAVVRLISPHLKDKKTDPAVIVIDDQSQFVISTLSGHLGGANELTNDIAKKENVSSYSTLDELKKSKSKGYLIISDEHIDDNDILENAVVYRPPSLVVGIGLHWNTTKEKIMEGLDTSLKKFNLSKKSIARLASTKKREDAAGLHDFTKEMNVPLELYDKDDLAPIKTPNPSKMVEGYEGTASVSEAAAIKSSGGSLIVEKQKFSPDLTIAIARIQE